MSGALRVVKMSGSGNDFLVLGPDEARRLEGRLEPWVRKVCRRGLSVGADGVLVVEPSGPDRVRVTFRNPDGSLAFCGNGSRCAARFARSRQLAGDSMLLETAAGQVQAQILGDRVRLVLPPPEDRGTVEILVDDEHLRGRSVLAGVPHFVVFVDSPSSAPLSRWGPAVRRHPHFGAEGTNFDVARAERDGSLSLRTWERGVERETLACGSGAIATAFAARLDGGAERVRVVPASGIPLEVEMPGSPERPRAAVLGGDARFILEGELDAEATTGF